MREGDDAYVSINLGIEAFGEKGKEKEKGLQFCRKWGRSGSMYEYVGRGRGGKCSPSNPRFHRHEWLYCMPRSRVGVGTAEDRRWRCGMEVRDGDDWVKGVDVGTSEFWM